MDEIHPGEVLLEDFMMPSRISALVNGRRPITADTALRLQIFFVVGSRFWMNLQAGYDTRIATREWKDRLTSCIRLFQPLAAA